MPLWSSLLGGRDPAKCWKNANSGVYAFVGGSPRRRLWKANRDPACGQADRAARAPTRSWRRRRSPPTATTGSLLRDTASSHRCGPPLVPFRSLSIKMREIVHIQAGQCGNQIGAKFWEVSVVIAAGWRAGVL